MSNCCLYPAGGPCPSCQVRLAAVEIAKQTAMSADQAEAALDGLMAPEAAGGFGKPLDEAKRVVLALAVAGIDQHGIGVRRVLGAADTLREAIVRAAAGENGGYLPVQARQPTIDVEALKRDHEAAADRAAYGKVRIKPGPRHAGKRRLARRKLQAASRRQNRRG